MKIYSNPDQSLVMQQNWAINVDSCKRAISVDIFIVEERSRDLTYFEQFNHPLPDGSFEAVGKQRIQLLGHKELKQWFSSLYDDKGIYAYKFEDSKYGYMGVIHCNRNGFIPFVPEINDRPAFKKGAYIIQYQDNDGIHPPIEVGSKFFEHDFTNWDKGSSVIGWKPVAY
jgi:hypothetical protein